MTRSYFQQALTTTLVLAAGSAASAQNLLLDVPIGDTLPTAMIGLPDIDGDGAADLIVGQGFDAAGGERAGRVHVLSGQTGALIHRLDGQAAFDELGSALASPGDVNGDGVADFVVGAPGRDGIGSNSGVVRVYSGANAAVLWEYAGGGPAWQVGRSLAPLDDVDGDGVNEILAGATAFMQDRGRVVVLSGRTGAWVHSIDGVQPASRFGVSVQDVGDLDLDGRADFAVGASRENNYRGVVRVYSGATATLLQTIVGDAESRSLGWRIAAFDDTQADGVLDVIVSSLTKSVAVHSGVDGAPLQTFGPPGFQCGRWIAAGDFDGNGDRELAFTAGLDFEPFVKVISSDGTIRFRIAEAQAVAAAGDVDADGREDLMVVVGEGFAYRLQVRNAVCGPLGGAYCTALPNTTGASAGILADGSASVLANDYTLSVSDVPPSAPGLFFYGDQQQSVSFGNGLRCVGGAAYRLHPVRPVDASGRLSRLVDFTRAPAGVGPGQIAVGSTWNFQFWYRDGQAGGFGFNLSDAWSTTFCR